MTVYIVDDEPMASAYLRKLLAETGLDVEVIGSSCSSVRGVKEIIEKRPDFVFADINMPVMNGLEMTGEIRKYNPTQKIFLLTAYKDFEYAKEGVKLGVADYLLKNEISEEKLRDLLLHHWKKMEEERKSTRVVFEKNIRDFLTAGQELSGSDSIYINKPLQQYILFYICRVPVITLRKIKEEKEGDSVFAGKLQKTLNENGIMCKAFLKVKPGTYAAILFTFEDVGNAYRKCWSIAGRILDALQREDYVVIISHPTNRFFNLPNSWKRMDAKAAWICSTGDHIMEEDDDSRFLRKENLQAGVQEKLLESWSDALENKDRKAETYLARYLQAMRNTCDNEQLSVEMQAFVRLFALKLRKIREDAQVYVKDSYESIEDLQEDLFSAQEICFQTDCASYNNQAQYVFWAKTVIDRHYSEGGLSVSEIAEEVGISAGHLRRCFQTIEGESIVSFLTKYRLSEAKKQMCDTNKTIEEICNHTGFSSVQYFGYVFKKYEKMTPGEYIRQHRNKFRDEIHAGKRK